MKINNDCARDVLIEVSKIPYGEDITIMKLSENLKQYALEDVLIVVNLFNKTSYLTILNKASYDDNDVFKEHHIKGLTERGYRNLDLIKSIETWNLLKSKLPDFSDLSIFTILEIAYKIQEVNVNKIFNLPQEFLVNGYRV